MDDVFLEPVERCYSLKAMEAAELLPILQGRSACVPGGRDYEGRSLVVIPVPTETQPWSKEHLEDTLRYFQAIYRCVIESKGVRQRGPGVCHRVKKCVIVVKRCHRGKRCVIVVKRCVIGVKRCHRDERCVKGASGCIIEDKVCVRGGKVCVKGGKVCVSVLKRDRGDSERPRVCRRGPGVCQRGPRDASEEVKGVSEGTTCVLDRVRGVSERARGVSEEARGIRGGNRCVIGGKRCHRGDKWVKGAIGCVRGGKRCVIVVKGGFSGGKSPDTRRNGLAVIVDAQRGAWRLARACIRQVMATLASDAPSILVLRPDAFWDKQRVDNCARMHRDGEPGLLGHVVSLPYHSVPWSEYPPGDWRLESGHDGRDLKYPPSLLFPRHWST
uniref:Uncharacterized protein n=1 Tax=Timema shepardi TaxID=629360 RepID=A0A7R9ALG0_TIMSH|nr:unnamed protein product [Timema shepardi]